MIYSNLSNVCSIFLIYLVLELQCNKCLTQLSEQSCVDKLEPSSAGKDVRECVHGNHLIDDDTANAYTVIKTSFCSTSEKKTSLCDLHQRNSSLLYLCFSKKIFKEEIYMLTCVNGIWTPNASDCTRICKPIVLSAVNVTCFHSGKKINCSNPLLIGTKIYPQCELYYQPIPEMIECQANGEWNYETVECIPECGRQFKERVRYTRTMRSAEFREFPWNVLIYYTRPKGTSPILIPGTIISPDLVITTAVNFYSDYREGILNTDSVIVVVAKKTTELEVVDDLFQKIYKVRNIYFTEVGYQTYELSLTSENIAIIQLSEKIILNPSVYPACINWAKNSKLDAEENVIGQVPHTFTINDKEVTAIVPHEILQTIAVRYVSHDKCIKTDNATIAPHLIKIDNFCSELIARLAPYDGSFIFLEPATNLFYLQGLVDRVLLSSDVPPKFTNTFINLSAHMEWINSIRKLTDNHLRINNVQEQNNTIDQTGVLCSTRTLTFKELNNVDIHSVPKSRLSDFYNKNVVINSSRSLKSTQAIQCTKEQFVCENKSCIPKAAVCNGSTECDNGEDESFEFCKILRTWTCIHSTIVKNYCDENNDHLSLRERKYSFLCNAESLNNTGSISMTCIKGIWTPSTEHCIRMCQNITLFVSSIECFRNERRQNCKMPLLIGTKIISHCGKGYRPNPAEVTCNANGEWDYAMVECIAVCGELAKTDSKMTQTTRIAEFREFPWNIALYIKSNEKTQPSLFAGILISSSLLLTSAICCKKDMDSNLSSNDRLEIVVAKRSADKSVIDDEFQKSFKVKNIYFSDDETVNIGKENIAIVELSEKVTFSTAVQPACVRWHKTGINLKSGTMGTIPHWRTRNSSYLDSIHDMLLAVTMKVQSKEECRTVVPSMFLPLLDENVFCVGPTGSNLAPSQPGSGFIYQDPETKLYYVEGILSFNENVKEPQSILTYSTVFLNISSYIDWISSIYRQVEQPFVNLNFHLVENYSAFICQTFNDHEDQMLHTNFNSSMKLDYSANGCTLPTRDQLFMPYIVSCFPSNKQKECNNTGGGWVPEFTSIVLNCSKNYVFNSSNEFLCFKGNWSPSLEPCTKLCDKLPQYQNINLKCFWRGRRISCNSRLKAGTVATAECAFNYKSVKNIPDLVCNDNGHWNELSDDICLHFDPWNEHGR